jgi:predicted amidohydrolase YtcJ
MGIRKRIIGKKTRRYLFLLFALMVSVSMIVSGCEKKDAATENAAPSGDVADTVFTNAFVYTGGEASQEAEAVAVKDGLIAFVGSAKDAEAYTGDKTNVVDLGGKMLMPSFFESHGHLQSKTEDLFSVNLKGKETVDDYIAAVKTFSDENPGAEFISGFGWLNTKFPPEGPSRKLLDEIRDDIPICLNSEDYHSVWVNSKALELAKITKDTEDPEGGVIERDADGEPSGALRENAQGLVTGLLPDYTVDQYKEGLLAYQEMAHALGFTGALDAVLGMDSNAIEAYKQLAEEGALKMRIRGAYATNAKGLDSKMSAFEGAREKDSVDDLFRITTLKIFEDGVVEGLTAYLLEPYAPGTGKPEGYKGEPQWNPENMKKFFAAAEEAGFQIHVHAIGDGAVRDALDAFAYAEEENGKKDYRNAITHLQLVVPEDFKRFGDMGIIAAVNPYWHFKDDYYYNLQLPYLGDPRAEDEYPMKSFLDAGVKLASASDYPVTMPPDPLFGIEVGVTRTVPDGDLSYGMAEDTENPEKYKLPLWPEECVSVGDMITSFTYNGAYANFLEDVTGSIEVGKSADMIVLNNNLFEIEPTEISKSKLLLTMFRGDIVYEDDAAA